MNQDDADVAANVSTLIKSAMTMNDNNLRAALVDLGSAYLSLAVSYGVPRENALLVLSDLFKMVEEGHCNIVSIDLSKVTS